MARYLSAAVAGVLALSSTVLAQPGPQPTPLIPCTYNVPNVNAGYDLSSLTAEAGFLIADNRNNSAANNGAVYNYYVSVCRNMSTCAHTTAVRACAGRVVSSVHVVMPVCTRVCTRVGHC
ncbi:hypothetical protein EON67_06935 [archaeon]|nr:MAG: hypothetical protein EON67_06935 [archaeon]